MLSCKLLKLNLNASVSQNESREKNISKSICKIQSHVLNVSCCDVNHFCREKDKTNSERKKEKREKKLYWTFAVNKSLDFKTS